MTHKLLLADDSITIQRVIELTFSGEDIEVISVGDGDAAVERLRRERPDIVLADISMPRRNGYDVAAYVRSQFDVPRIPVLLLAGAFETVDQARAEQVGCDGVLVKPFEPQQVVARVHELLARARAARPSTPAPQFLPEETPSVDAVPRSDTEAPAPTADAESAAKPPAGHGAVHAGGHTAPELEAPPLQPGGRAAAEDGLPEPEAEPPSRGTAGPAAGEAPAPAFVAGLQASGPIPPAPAVGLRRDGDPFDDYFGRLRSSSDAAPVRGAVTPDEFDDPWTYGDVPTVSGVLGATPPSWPGAGRLTGTGAGDRAGTPRDAFASEGSDRAAAGRRDPGATATGSFIADAFHALLESEQGRPRAAEPWAGAAAPPVAAPPPRTPAEISDELVERVTQRVIERLVPNAARELVAGIVSDVAERLVREEIARAQARLDGRQ